MSQESPRDLFAEPGICPLHTETLSDGAVLLRGFASESAPELIDGIAQIAAKAPFRHMQTPGGYRMSVAMTSCGDAGWVSDRRGYRYAVADPETGDAWPAMPELFRELARRAAATAGFEGFDPDTCLINRYEPGAKLSLHQDRDERDFTAPIVSVSLGLPATFLFGGLRRRDKTRRIPLQNGDVVVWGGPARMTYHGLAPLRAGQSPPTQGCRFNLTFRKAL